MHKRLFVVTKIPDGVAVSYEPSLRNFLLHLYMKCTGGVPDDLPIGEWSATFSWRYWNRFNIIPGIYYRDL